MTNSWAEVRAHLAVCALFTLMGAQTLAQQPNTGRVSGHVVDPVGAIIKGASIFVRRTSPPEEDVVRLQTHTDIHGDFKLVLPEGGYDVLVTSAGFASGFQTIPVWAGKDKSTAWRLKPLGCNFPSVMCDTVQ